MTDPTRDYSCGAPRQSRTKTENIIVHRASVPLQVVSLHDCKERDRENDREYDSK